MYGVTITAPLPPVLLIIDLQEGLVAGPLEWGPRSTPSLEENATQLLITWREKHWPIMHVHHDDIFDDTNIIAAKHPATFAPHACAVPRDGEQVFVKNVGSAFVNTGLQAAVGKGQWAETKETRPVILPARDGTFSCSLITGPVSERQWEKRRIVVAGMDGTQCINNTTRHGVDLGYEMIVVGDACASYPVVNWRTGKKMSPEETHDAAMSLLVSTAQVTTTKDVLSVLNS